MLESEDFTFSLCNIKTASKIYTEIAFRSKKSIGEKNVTYSRCTIKYLLVAQHHISTQVASAYYQCFPMPAIIYKGDLNFPC